MKEMDGGKNGEFNDNNNKDVIKNDNKKENKDNIVINKIKDEREYINDVTQILLDKFNKEDIMNISFKKLINKNNLYFSLRYYKNTEFNPYNKDICFSITLQDKKPYKIINIKCLSSFCFPNFCDGRNFYKAIVSRNNKKLENNQNANKINTKDNYNILYINNEYNDDISSLEIIIDLIPNFIKEVKKNEEKQHLLKFWKGEYNVDEIYDINDFLIGVNNKFFRAKQIIDQKELDRYIIITDIYFILIEPLEEFKNKGLLLFFGYLHKLEKEETNDKNTFNLTWSKNKNQNKITIKIKIENNKENLFKIIQNKIALLISKYKNIEISNN